MAHLELIFVAGVRSVLRFILCLWSSSYWHPGLYAEKTSLSPLNCLSSLVQDQLIILVWVSFWALCFVSIICLFIVSPIPHCLDYCSFIISLKLRYWESSMFFVFSALLLSHLPTSPFCLHYQIKCQYWNPCLVFCFLEDQCYVLNICGCPSPQFIC